MAKRTLEQRRSARARYAANRHKRGLPPRPVKFRAEKFICGECANELDHDDLAGRGGCGTCGDGTTRCHDCHEMHAGGCFGERWPGQDEEGR